MQRPQSRRASMFWEDAGLLVEGKRGLSIGTSEGCGTGAFEDLGPQALAWTIILGNQNHGDWWGPGGIGSLDPGTGTLPPSPHVPRQPVSWLRHSENLCSCRCVCSTDTGQGAILVQLSGYIGSSHQRSRNPPLPHGLGLSLSNHGLD